MATVWGSFAVTQMYNVKELKMGEGNTSFRNGILLYYVFMSMTSSDSRNFISL
jgi:hypothetical protein